MDVGCTAVCWSLNASTFIILFDMYIQHFPFHMHTSPSLFPLFLVETWEPISLGFHTLTPGMPQRLLVKLLVLFACFFFVFFFFCFCFFFDNTLVEWLGALHQLVWRGYDLRMLSIGKSRFPFRISDFGFPNKTRSPKTDLDEPNHFPRRISIKDP